MDFEEASSDAGKVVEAMQSTNLAPSLPISSSLISSPNTSESSIKTLSSSYSPGTSVSRRFRGAESFSQLLAAAMLIESLNDPAFTITTSQGTPAVPLLTEKDKANTDSGENRSPGSMPQFKSASPAEISISQSPIISTGKAEPLPTTGTFPLPLHVCTSGLTCASALDSFKDQMPDSKPEFVFRSIFSLGKNDWTSLANLGPFGVSHQQALQQVEEHAQSQVHVSPLHLGTILAPSPTTTGSDYSDDATKFLPLAEIRDPPECTSQALVESSIKAQGLQLVSHRPYLVERPSEDDYNWRKYGQKQLKGRGFPCSYYRCTHPSCIVKKRVERALDGQALKIVYKGEHNHLKPNATRRVIASASLTLDGTDREVVVEGINTYDKKNDHSNQAYTLNIKSELTSTFSYPSLSGGNGTPEPSSFSINGDDAAGNKIQDGGVDEPDSKRRNKEKTDNSPIALIRTVPESRIVVQTTSEADILHDGYRWRKYGQKFVKGSPYPRSYYKCTNLGCSVRKHVERSYIDPKAVIITYEGKHSHEIPAASTFSNTQAVVVQPP